MSEVRIGRWGKSLAVRLPSDVARAAELREGESVEIEAREGDIVIRRPEHHRQARADAQTAIAEILAESRNYSLGGVSIRDLIDQGRD